MRYLTIIFLLALMITIVYSCQKTPEKQPPAASFTISPTDGSILTNFVFNGSQSSDGTDPATSLMVRWDFNGDEIWDTDFNAEKITDWQYDVPGLYTVYMEVLNTDGWTDLETKNLQVFADSLPPTASFIVHPDTAVASTIFYFGAGNSFDPYTPVNELKFRWDWQNDGIWDTPFTSDSSIYHKYVNEGEYRILMEVINNLQITDTTSRLIMVYEP